DGQHRLVHAHHGGRPLLADLKHHPREDAHPGQAGLGVGRFRVYLQNTGPRHALQVPQADPLRVPGRRRRAKERPHPPGQAAESRLRPRRLWLAVAAVRAYQRVAAPLHRADPAAPLGHFAHIEPVAAQGAPLCGPRPPVFRIQIHSLHHSTPKR
ncbi:MAG: hypothetical protein HOC91_07315, partial [Nitrospinaceae bacterium]|nr:hypothetical protein [Nitrospinaceae bacterium]